MSADGYSSFQGIGSAASKFNALRLMVDGILARVRTATLVQVKAVTNSGGVSPVGFVDILPLVNQVDGAGTATQHGTIFKCPYLRIQGGANALILDPQVGDIGVAVFADRDISSATTNKGPSNPGSRRRFSMADGLYLGGVLNSVPSQYVRFSGAGIEVHSPTQVKLTAPDVRIDATTVEINAQTVTIVATSSATVTSPTTTINGNLVVNGTIAGSSSISAPTVAAATSLTVATKEMGGHVHGGVSTGVGVTGAPV